MPDSNGELGLELYDDDVKFLGKKKKKNVLLLMLGTNASFSYFVLVYFPLIFLMFESFSLFFPTK